MNYFLIVHKKNPFGVGLAREVICGNFKIKIYGYLWLIDGHF